MIKKAVLVTLGAAQLTPSTNAPCGDPTNTYVTGEPMILCLYFPTIQQKVVFGPTVDLFDALQIQGLWSHFKNHSQGDLVMTAISNGIESRPVVFRKDNLTVPILNLVVQMTGGYVTALEWRNTCYDDQVCNKLDCVDTTFNGEGILSYPEMNCVK